MRSIITCEEDQMDRHVAHMGEMRNTYKTLIGKAEGKTPFGKPRRGWEDNIRMDVRDMGWEVVDWI
jgi:hypothetical protein